MTNIQMVLTLFIIDDLNNSVSGGRGLPETVNISSFSAVQVIRVTFSWQGVLNVKLLNILPPIFFKKYFGFSEYFVDVWKILDFKKFLYQRPHSPPRCEAMAGPPIFL